jgi:PAS domain-containing protein
MAQHGIETILMRRLASRLTMPILLVDPQGELVYFNAAAGGIAGMRLEDFDPAIGAEWTSRFEPVDGEGQPIPRRELPHFMATERREPCHRRFWMRGLDGVAREIESIAFPLIGQGQRMLGAVVVFWDLRSPPKAGVPATGHPIDLASPGGDRPLELLLMRQLASYLKTVIFLLGPDGTPLFYNESAEQLIGRRFDEDEQMSAEEWTALLPLANEVGTSLAFEERPMIVALHGQRPAHRRFSIRGFDGVDHDIEGLGFPLVALEGRQLGAVGIFWARDTA